MAAVPRALYGRMVIYKAMCDLLWTLWGLIQIANKNPVDDFWAYAIRRFERCKALMATPDFARHLDAIATGTRIERGRTSLRSRLCRLRFLPPPPAGRQARAMTGEGRGGGGRKLGAPVRVAQIPNDPQTRIYPPP